MIRKQSIKTAIIYKTLDEVMGLTDSISLFRDSNKIYIPKNIEKILESKQLEDELLKIHKDKKLAIEYCLIFISNLIDTSDESNGWVKLASKQLKLQIPGSSGKYKRVVDFLSSEIVPTFPLIEIKCNAKGKPSYEVGVNSIQYRLLEPLSSREWKIYNLTSSLLIEQKSKLHNGDLENVFSNPISTNLLKVYARTVLPTVDEILSEAKKLTKRRGGYLNNKGKKLTILNGRKKDDFKDFYNRVSYDDNLKVYRHLTYKGLIIPKVSGERAGGRVYDSFNMMPAFIRNLIKIDGERVVDVDFKCLHPNLAIKLYKGNCKNITHEQIAKELNISIAKVKLEHLSFFNKNIKQMESSSLYKYYESNDPKMLDNLINDKRVNSYKTTSKRLFSLEVEIMKECIARLNMVNIFPLYVFDAFLVKESDRINTENIMNEILKEKKIYTVVGSV